MKSGDDMERLKKAPARPIPEAQPTNILTSEDRRKLKESREEVRRAAESTQKIITRYLRDNTAGMPTDQKDIQAFHEFGKALKPFFHEVGRLQRIHER